MHCVYDVPDEEENVIGVVDEDNQTSISDAVDEDVIEHRMSRQQQVQQSVNEALDKSNGSHNRDFEYVYV